MCKKIYNRTLLLLLLFFFLAFFWVSSANAQGISLGIYPPIIEINTTPPASINAPIAIENNQDEPVDLRVSLKPFYAAPSYDGKLIYLPDDTLTGPDPLILQKIQITLSDRRVEKIHLDPFESKTINLHIGINKGDPRGDYYFSILFITDGIKDIQSSTSRLPAGIGTNVLLSVGPKGPTNGQIVTFSAPRFLTGGPVPFKLFVRNSSNHFIVPTGTIYVKNVFGETVGKVDLLPQYILSYSYRYLVDKDQASPSAELVKLLERIKLKNNSALWGEKFLFGFYTATARVSLSNDGGTLTSTTHFLALPLPILFGLILVITIILGIYLRITKKV